MGVMNGDEATKLVKFIYLDKRSYKKLSLLKL